MKPKFHNNRFFAGSIALFATVSALHAVPLTWDPGSGGTTDGAGAWLGTGLWWDGAANVDWTSGDDATFGNSGAGGAVTLASPTTVGSITFNAFTGTYTLGTADQLITLNSGITKNAGSAAATFLGPVTLGGNQTWTNNSTGTLSTGRLTNLIDNGGFNLTVDGTGAYNFGTINNTEAALTGSGALVKNGSGRLNIGGVNSGFTGTVTINGGVLQANNNAGALGNGNLTLNGGVLSFYWSTTYTRTLAASGNDTVQILGGESGFAGAGTTGPTINLGSSVVWGALGEGTATGFFNPSKFVLGDAGTGNAAVTTFSSAIDLNGATRTILVPAGTSSGLNRTTISGAISNSTGTAGLIKEGGGILFLTAAPTYNGTTTVSDGRVDFAGLSLDSMGGGVGVRDITVAAGAVVRRGALDNAFLQRLVETTDEIGVMSGTTGNSFDFSSSTGANLPNAFLGNWASNGAKAEISGTITPGSNGYLFGARGSNGLLGIRGVLSGANDLTVGMTGSGGIRVNIVAENTHTGDTVINAGSRLVLGNNLALQNSALNVGAAGGGFSLGAGTLSNRITGETNTSSPTLGGLIGSRNLISVFSSGGGNNEANLLASAVTGFTLNVGTGNTHTYSGAIGGFGAGAVSGTGGDSTLTKSGEGTQILTGTHTYTGATTINGGTLDLGTTGLIAASTSLVIDAAGTLNTSGQSSYAIPASQSLTFGLDATSSGKITADGLDITDAAVTFTGTTDAAVYVLATYTAPLTGAAFASVTLPSGYTIDYAYEGNKIALLSGAPVDPYTTWSGGAAFDADANGDGVSNGLAFLLGAVGPNVSALDKLPTVSQSGGGLVMTFSMLNSASRGTAALGVEHSSDLGISDTWTTVLVPDTAGISGPTSGVTFNVTLGSPSNSVTATISSSEAASGKLFGRLKATE